FLKSFSVRHAVQSYRTIELTRPFQSRRTNGPRIFACFTLIYLSDFSAMECADMSVSATGRTRGGELLKAVLPSRDRRTPKSRPTTKALERRSSRRRLADKP